MVKQGFFDLRTALDFLDARHELTEVTGEVDWDLELGAVTREVFRRRGPALLYTNIKGYNTPAARSTAPERRNLAELIDATKTWRFPRRLEWNSEKFPPVSLNRQEDIERVRVNWPNYKFTGWKADF